MNERNLYHRLNSFSYTELKTFTLGCIDKLEELEQQVPEKTDHLKIFELTEILKICQCFFEGKFGKNLPEIISYYQKKHKKKEEIRALREATFDKNHNRFMIASFILTFLLIVYQNFKPLSYFIYTVNQFFRPFLNLIGYILSY